MTKLSFLAVLTLVCIGVERMARVVLSLFILLVFGAWGVEIVRSFRRPAKGRAAA